MTSVIAAGLAAGGLASPAAADDGSGTYTFNWVNGGETQHLGVPSCGVMCPHVSDARNSRHAPWESDAYALNGYWTLFVQRPDMITCDDGTTFAAHAAYYWDVAGNGLVETNNAGECGQPPGPLRSR
jgi:hypothetical protein